MSYLPILSNTCVMYRKAWHVISCLPILSNTCVMSERLWHTMWHTMSGKAVTRYLLSSNLVKHLCYVWKGCSTLSLVSQACQTLSLASKSCSIVWTTRWICSIMACLCLKPNWEFSYQLNYWLQSIGNFSKNVSVTGSNFVGLYDFICSLEIPELIYINVQ